MANFGYGYQYETSPRKLNEYYDIPKTKKKKKANKKPKIKSEKLKQKQRDKEQKLATINFAFVMVIVVLCVLLIMYRMVKINENFSEIQALNKEISEIEKVNSQLSVDVQNSMNLSTIESIATTTLGMQKRATEQTAYITLDKPDYVESNIKPEEEKESLINKLLNKISDIF